MISVPAEAQIARRNMLLELWLGGYKTANPPMTTGGHTRTQSSFQVNPTQWYTSEWCTDEPANQREYAVTSGSTQRKKQKPSSGVTTALHLCPERQKLNQLEPTGQRGVSANKGERLATKYGFPPPRQQPPYRPVIDSRQYLGAMRVKSTIQALETCAATH